MIEEGKYYTGCIGLKSVPVTCAEGYCCAVLQSDIFPAKHHVVFIEMMGENLPNSMAHVPVPQPMSRTLCGGLGNGARCHFPSNVSNHMWCWSSNLSLSNYPPYISISSLLLMRFKFNTSGWNRGNRTNLIIWNKIFCKCVSVIHETSNQANLLPS